MLGAHHRVLHRFHVATAFHRAHRGANVENTVRSERPSVAKAAVAGGLMSGIASVYSGGRTANGETAGAGGLTAAHRTLPFGTMVRVTNLRNGRSVVVRINDRGPFIRGRVLDVSKAAAQSLGFIGSGHTAICLSRES